jgi:hypothetical protein
LARRKKKSGSFLSIPLFTNKKKPKRRTRAQKQANATRLKLSLSIAAIITIFAAATVGFVFLKGYVEKVSPVTERFGPIKINRPLWYNDHLGSFIAAALGGTEFQLVPGTARDVAEELEKLSWLYDVKVITRKDRIKVTAGFRKPVAVVNAGGSKYYLDANMVVLDYLPMTELNIIAIDGVDTRTIPPPSNQWFADDADAATELIDLLARMDAKSTPDAPLLAEIKSINMTNYDGRKDPSSKRPHIVLFAHDGTEIFWGAAVGQSARYFEATDTEKLGQLYSDYKRYGTVQGSRSNEKFKYLDLRVPQGKIPLP